MRRMGKDMIETDVTSSLIPAVNQGINPSQQTNGSHTREELITLYGYKGLKSYFDSIVYI